ncbi:calcium-activated chloride channel regulator 4 [Perognathus longimembris pacificus]|uniref:calcium-activated chloride channel regulator 4 n=1 Tax=Perognathus longimembris pacificus TaxID=214514 RepID=UPI002018BC5F|nr:calcium-activated chloride channel regulator 4 [Perognathus longimembris pacificus]
MGLCKSFVFFLLLYLLQGSNASFVRLNDNGYEDIIIAIDPSVPEDEKIIQEIQEMVTTASTYLFEATEKRFFFKNVSILIPENWKASPQYRKPKHESYTHADVIVAPPTIPGRDDPYTRQFKGCGEKAEYIHFTPDFVLGKKQNEYGPSGKLFVHEWAHLRWGVFDEYNDDQRFYIARSKKIEATRCSTGISGENRVNFCQEGSCVLRRCRIDSTTKLYEKDCQFFPDKDQTEKTSIMFMQSIDSVAEFCDEKNHNHDAPSLQNMKCDHRSTWEVISNSEDFKMATSMEESPPPPVFSLLRSSERIVCLVLDISGSMLNSNRLSRMNQAAKYFLLQIVENGSWVGMVHFNYAATVFSELIQIKSNTERNKLVESLPKQAGGGTSICSGIESAFKVIEKQNPQIDGSEIVLLTDGEDNSAKDCIDTVTQSGAIIHFIALGEAADQAVIQMSNITGGKHLFVSDVAENNGLIDAFGTLTSENANPTQKSLQLESKGSSLTNNTWMNDTVTIDSTVGKDTFFLVTWKEQPPSISLWDPSGAPIHNFILDSNSKMAYVTIPGTAQVGNWAYSLQSNANQEILTITVTSWAANSSVSPITVNAKMNKDANSFPNPMIIYAEVLQGYSPILGATVTAIIESQSGHTEVLKLLDNGAGADSFKNDGVYSRYFTAYTENGRYSLKVRAHGGTNSAKRSLQYPANRAAFIPGWVVNGEVQANPPRPEINEDDQTFLENFSRTALGDAFVMSQVPPGPLPDLYPPSQIIDLYATFDEDKINLTWTAPGDDFDNGTVKEYIIRISGNMLDLRDNFDNALQVDTSNLLPSEANSEETFAFKPGNISEENATYIFIAIQSIDKSNLTSKLSNIAQVALFVPEGDPGPDPGPGNAKSGVNITTLVVSVVASVVLVCLIVGATAYLLKRRSSKRASTTF